MIVMTTQALTLDHTIRQAARLSGELGIRTLDLQADIAALAERVTAQATTIEAIGSEANILSGDVDNVAIAARDARNDTAAAKIVIEDSTAQLGTATSDVVELIEQVSHIHNGLGAFNTALSDVSAVTAGINVIARQTNLLALNATIEAARAGESGKGFAVVAGEVKELARETAQATEDISRKVAAIQADTGSAVDAIERIAATIDRINDLQAGIAAAAEEQTATTASMNRDVADAATGTSEISAGISTVATAARGTTEDVARSRESADELTRLSAQLGLVVGRFRL